MLGNLFLDIYSKFVHAESDLERFLQANPPEDKNIVKARENLRETHNTLLDVSRSENAKVSILMVCFFGLYLSIYNKLLKLKLLHILTMSVI